MIGGILSLSIAKLVLSDASRPFPTSGGWGWVLCMEVHTTYKDLQGGKGGLHPIPVC